MESDRILILVNPFSRGTRSGAASGIDVYCRTVAALLDSRVRLRVIDDEEGLDRQAFREKVRDIVTSHHPDDVVVEAPEARASTLLVPEEYAVHVRVHCPLALAQHHESVAVDHDALHEELSVIRRASLVSAPSYTMAREIHDALPDVTPLVFRNPPPVVPSLSAARKSIDVIVLSRFQRVKGADYLVPILRRLPRDMRVLLVGDGMDYLPLGRRIRCHVERRPELSGAERFELLARARVALVPSRFESFSMVVAESLACGTTAVAWNSGAAAELAPPPFVRIATEGDFDVLGQALLETCRAGDGEYPSRQQFSVQAERLREDFERGVKFAIEYAHTSVRPPFAPSPEYSAEHPGYVQPAPVLGRVFRGEIMTSETPDPFRLRRKLRKLRRDPAAFLRDVQVPLLGRVFRGEISLGSLRKADPEQREPRLLGRVLWQNNALTVERYDNKISEPELATAIFSKRQDAAFRQRPILGDILADTKFIGFRDRYLFVFEHDLAGCFTHPADLALLFEASTEWTQRLTRSLRNVVFIDPQDVLPFLVRATNHDVRLIVFATPECRPELLAAFGHQIDVLITTPGALRGEEVRARLKVEVENPAQFLTALQRLVIDHRDKEKNMLLPVYGDPGFIEDIDQLNQRKIDGVLLLRDGAFAPKGNTLRALVTALTGQVRAVLLTEERFHQYKDFCERGDLLGLLLTSIEDGCRYDVRS